MSTLWGFYWFSNVEIFLFLFFPPHSTPLHYLSAAGNFHVISIDFLSERMRITKYVRDSSEETRVNPVAVKG